MAFAFRFEVQHRCTRDGSPFTSLRFADGAEYIRFKSSMTELVAKLCSLGEANDAAAIDSVLNSSNVKLLDNSGRRFATVLNMFDGTGEQFLQALVRASIILTEKGVV